MKTQITLRSLLIIIFLFICTNNSGTEITTNANRIDNTKTQTSTTAPGMSSLNDTNNFHADKYIIFYADEECHGVVFDFNKIAAGRKNRFLVRRLCKILIVIIHVLMAFSPFIHITIG